MNSNINNLTKKTNQNPKDRQEKKNDLGENKQKKDNK